MAVEGKYVNRNIGQELYVIEHSEGFVKVGRSKNPEDRRRNLDRNCPACDLVLVETFEIGGGYNPALVENYVHDRLSEYEVQSEWFDISAGSAVEIVSDSIAEYEESNEPEPEAPPGPDTDLPDNHFVRVFRILDESGVGVSTTDVGRQASLNGTRNAEVLTTLEQGGVVESEIGSGGSGRPPTLWSISDSFQDTVESAVDAGLFPSREAAVRKKLEGVVREHGP